MNISSRVDDLLNRGMSLPEAIAQAVTEASKPERTLRELSDGIPQFVL